MNSAEEAKNVTQVEAYYNAEITASAYASAGGGTNHANVNASYSLDMATVDWVQPD